MNKASNPSYPLSFNFFSLRFISWSKRLLAISARDWSSSSSDLRDLIFSSISSSVSSSGKASDAYKSIFASSFPMYLKYSLGVARNFSKDLNFSRSFSSFSISFLFSFMISLTSPMKGAVFYFLLVLER